MATSSALLLHVRRADPDRFFCSLFAPPETREALWLLYAFNHELARAREVASEPTLALIRLAWWREVIEGAEKKHEIATPLSAALRENVFSRNDLAALIDAREAEAAEIPDFDSFMKYARGTAGTLARIAGKLLGADSALGPGTSASDPFAFPRHAGEGRHPRLSLNIPALHHGATTKPLDIIEDFGTAYGISGILRAAPFLLRQNRSLLPVDGTSEAELIETASTLLQATPPPREARAAWLPAAYARRDLGNPYRPRGLGDKLAVLRAALTGRL